MVPLSTTTIRVLRPNPSNEPYEAKGAPTVVASGVRAHISSPSGREIASGGSQEVVQFRLSCDPVDLNHLDQVQDETTDELYEVEWARQRIGVGLDYTQAGLKQVSGAVSRP